MRTGHWVVPADPDVLILPGLECAGHTPGVNHVMPAGPQIRIRRRDRGGGAVVALPESLLEAAA